MTAVLARSRAMPVALLAAVAAIAIVFGFYRETLASMLDIWTRSETYAHGWIIVPISLWLVWRQRDQLLSIEPRFSVAGLAVMAMAALLWVAADIVGAQVVKHFTLWLIVVAATLTLLGWRATRQLAFPLGFLVFAVPFGEILIPTLMEITAVFSVAAIRLTGIPVYRDGMFFALPSGDFEVAVACSGIRYLIASVALGTLYAYLSFHSLRKRLMFMALSAIVPIIANGLRAYLIVMLAHLSDMKLAVGIDHFIYGWVFFGLVMFILFLIGSRYQEDNPPRLASGDPRPPAPLVVTALAGAALIAVAVSIPAMASAMRVASADRAMSVALPGAAAGWSGPLEPTLEFRPAYSGATMRRAVRYSGPDGDVHVYVEFYSPTDLEAELISDSNRLRSEEWIRADVGSRRTVGTARHSVIETPLRRRKLELTVWHWFEISGAATVNGPEVKIRKLADTLIGRFGGSALVALAATESTVPESAERALEGFVDSHLQSLRECLYTGRTGDDDCALR